MLRILAVALRRLFHAVAASADPVIVVGGGFFHHADDAGSASSSASALAAAGVCVPRSTDLLLQSLRLPAPAAASAAYSSRLVVEFSFHEAAADSGVPVHATLEFLHKASSSAAAEPRYMGLLLRFLGPSRCHGRGGAAVEHVRPPGMPRIPVLHFRVPPIVGILLRLLLPSVGVAAATTPTATTCVHNRGDHADVSRSASASASASALGFPADVSGSASTSTSASASASALGFPADASGSASSSASASALGFPVPQCMG
jgi:hypothetical protein